MVALRSICLTSAFILLDITVRSRINLANLPNNNEFALAAEAVQDNMNGWVEEEDPEMEEEEEDPEEDPEMEEEEEEIEVDEQWDGPEWILHTGGGPTAEAAPYHILSALSVPANPVPANPMPETATIGTCRLIPFRRLFTDTQVWTGSSSSAAAAGHNPEDLTPSHIRSDLDALHRRVQHIEEEDVRADNKRLKMMLDCSENRTRDAWRENDRATWHYHTWGSVGLYG
ncbi:hypothetical protein Tco_1455644 [Tanacetum coccineum]